MALHIDTTTEPKPSFPDGHAHEANKYATYATDAKGSKEAFERKIRRERDRATHKKVLEVSSQCTVIYGALAVALLLIVYWEWSISKEIYEVMIAANTPLVPFLGCVAIAFYASICIGESTSRFSVLSTDDTSESNGHERAEATAGRMYETRAKRKTKTNWLFHPAAGSLVALLFLGGIYLVSRHRVELLNAAGEMRDDTFQIWLPVILYGVEILLGIPTFFFAIWMYTWLHTRSQREKFSQARMNELVLHQFAVEAYTTYMREFELFNEWSRSHGTVEARLVPPNTDLRHILEESGYNLNPDGDGSSVNGSADNNRAGGGEAPTAAPASPDAYDDAPHVNAPHDNARHDNAPHDNAPHDDAPHVNVPHNGHDHSRREEDLLALLDERINSQNRGL